VPKSDNTVLSKEVYEITAEWLESFISPSGAPGAAKWKELSLEDRDAIVAIVRSGLEVLADSIESWLPQTLVSAPDDAEHLQVKFGIPVPRLSRDVARLCRARDRERSRQVEEMKSWVSSETE
jgi:hypothetical protein